ncbi:hypothetical protein FOA52_002907 [Chlamydomonas sp. UWO 241]|nr:hypothetical protein FOA52_002907 [Chlamydomonas sp. UWO 241]
MSGSRPKDMETPLATARARSSGSSGHSEIEASGESSLGSQADPVEARNPVYTSNTQAENPAYARPNPMNGLKESPQPSHAYGSDSYSPMVNKAGGVREYASPMQGSAPGRTPAKGAVGVYDARRLSDDEDYEDDGQYGEEDEYLDGGDGETEDYETDEEDDEEEALVLQKRRQPPVLQRWNVIPCLLFAWFLGASVYYYYVRWEFLTNAYAIFVFAIEIVGWTSFAPYAILITRGVYPTGSPGLPAAGSPEEDEQAAWWASPAKGHSDSRTATPMSHYHAGATPQGYGGSDVGPMSPSVVSIPETSYFMYRFHVRVLIPCYKEDLAVVASTVQAALSADLPAMTRRTVYLCDDGKDPEKQSFVEGLRLSGEDIVYVTGRIRKKGEVNGKSANLNNTLKNVVYKNYPKNDNGDIDWTEISNKECVVVFDADMNCKPDFYLKQLEVMVDDEIGLLLTPQAFYNIDTDMDIFNAINAQFWEYWLPGAFAWGYIACTGTNFMIRARALAHCGFFPTYTITEDYALGMELKAKGYKATYLSQYLAVGEAPEEARNIFQQRSRWTKGHYQVFFSGTNALLNMQLPFFQRLWYTYAAWAPMCASITTPSFMLVPFMSIVFGYNPVSITFEFVLASTIYFAALQSVQGYCTSWSHVKLMWYVNVSNTVLWFTYVKAFFNTLALKIGMKIATFKVTAKSKTNDPNAPPPLPPGALAPVPEGTEVGFSPAPVSSAPPTSTMGRMWNSIATTFTPRKASGDSAPLILPPPKEDEYAYPVRVGRETPVKNTPVRDPAKARLLGGSEYHATPAGPAGGYSAAYTATPMRTPQRGGGSGARSHSGYTQLPATYQQVAAAPVNENDVSGWARIKALAVSFKPANVGEFGRMMDPLALLLMWMFNMGTVGVGLWQLIIVSGNSVPSDFMFNSPLSGNPYLIISVVWAFYNSMSPFLFLFYCFSSGPSFKFMVKVIMVLSNLLMIGAVVIIWMLIPTDVDTRHVVDAASEYYYPASIANDTNTNYVYVWGQDGSAIPEVLLRGLLLPELTDTTQRALFQAGGVPDVNLLGGLLMSDHVKYAMPIAYSVAVLAWALIKFPDGVSKGKASNGLMTTLRAGADYLERSFIELPDGSSVYVAQVGDASNYAFLQGQEGFDPVSSSKIWTSPAQDPYLSGDLPRKVWLMTAGMIGADLMGEVAAALASSSMVFRASDSDFADRLVLTAEKVYQFATLGADAPQSYCKYVPCTANVTYTKQVMAHPFAAPPPDTPVCYYLDWTEKTCYFYMTVAECTVLANKQKEVYKTRDACCNAMQNTGMWDGLTSKAQGICAVPMNQTNCFIPDTNLRTCFEFNMTKLGRGCTGQGLEVYPTSKTCCNYLLSAGFIDASQKLPGTGQCSRVYQDPTFKSCFVPVLNNATCIELNGTDCAAFGISNSFDDISGCCNDIITTMQTLGFNKAGGIQLTTSGKCTLYFDQATGPPVRRSLLSRAADTVSSALQPLLSAGRALRQIPTDGLTITIGTGASSTPSAKVLIPIENTTFWIPLETIARSQCANNACEFILVNDYHEIAFFNSSSVMDDLAWAALWMYKATNNTLYMGQAQKFTDRHYKEDVSLATMVKDRTYYRSDWNNRIWDVNVIMTELTGKREFKARAELFLKTWVFGDSITLKSPLPAATAVVDVANITALTNFTDASSNITWLVVPQCTPTSDFEDSCDDGVDNNCNGLIDRNDPDCGLFPVLYTPKQLAFGGSPAGPLAASAALTALMYGEAVGGVTSRRMRCWALDQVAYLIGSMPGVSSLVVGVGRNSPDSVQHRGSSCPMLYSNVHSSFANVAKTNQSLVPDEVRAQLSTAQQTLLHRSAVATDEPPCNWDNAFYPSTPNPRLDLVKGALIFGPLEYYPFVDGDSFSRERSSPSAQIGLHHSVALTAVAMGLVHTETTLRSCELYHGVYQKYVDAGLI